jgi:hypothetical protein
LDQETIKRLRDNKQKDHSVCFHDGNNTIGSSCNRYYRLTDDDLLSLWKLWATGSDESTNMIIMERAVEGENFYDNEEAKSMVADFLFVGIWNKILLHSVTP